MEYFYEEELKKYEGYTNEELKRLWKENDDENARIVLAKRNHSIKLDMIRHIVFCLLVIHIQIQLKIPYPLNSLFLFSTRE